MINQKTISKNVSIQGIGLHSGESVTLTLKPAKPNSGIIFIRTDLKEKVLIKADPFFSFRYKIMFNTTKRYCKNYDGRTSNVCSICLFHR